MGHNLECVNKIKNKKDAKDIAIPGKLTSHSLYFKKCLKHFQSISKVTEVLNFLFITACQVYANGNIRADDNQPFKPRVKA